MNRFEILESVNRVLSERQETHGDAYAQFSLCAKLVNVYFGTDFTPADMATINRFQKMSRDKIGGFHIDNTLDSIGYTAIEGEIRCQHTALRKEYGVSDAAIVAMIEANTNAIIRPEPIVDNGDGSYSFINNPNNKYHPINLNPSIQYTTKYNQI